MGTEHLTCHRCGTGWQVMQPAMLICLWIFWFQYKGLSYMCCPSSDTFRWCPPNSVSSFTLIHSNCNRYCSPSSPFDQCHTIPDGLSHNLSITLMEKPRLHLMRRRRKRKEIGKHKILSARWGCIKKGLDPLSITQKAGHLKIKMKTMQRTTGFKC